MGTWLGVLVGLAVVSFVVEFYGIMRSYRISVYDVCDALIEKIADHTLQLPLGWFDAKREAQIASAMSREIDTLSHVASIIIPALVKQFVTPRGHRDCGVDRGLAAGAHYDCVRPIAAVGLVVHAKIHREGG